MVYDICFLLVWVEVSHCCGVHGDLVFCVCFLVYRLVFWFYDYYLYYVGWLWVVGLGWDKWCGVGVVFYFCDWLCLDFWLLFYVRGR